MASDFLCKQCNVHFRTLRIFFYHTQNHKKIPKRLFSCGLPTCPCSFKTFAALKSHMCRKHNETVTLHTNADASTVLSCQFDSCDHSSTNLVSMSEHLKWHLNDGQKVMCPFPHCDKHFSIKSSFTCHISRKHKHCLDKTSVPSDTAIFSEQHNDILHDLDSNIEDQSDISTNDTFLTNLALFYLRMQAQMLLPASTIQTLIEEFQILHDDNMNHMFTKLREELTMLNMPSGDIDNLLTGLNKNNLLKLYNEGLFRSDNTRKNYFKHRFNYVSPKKQYLGRNSCGKDCFLQYVPVKETLRALLSHESVKQQYNEAKESQPNDPHVLEDIRDGKLFKDNGIFNKSEASVSIILYQDGFEVVNPLGSGRKKHKQLAVYLSLGEISPHNRSAIDSIQLVMLCREQDLQYFGQEKVFCHLLQDLREIEEVGVQLDSGEIIKGAVHSIVGDNLGSHMIGGFTENFSKSRYFCRYCDIDRDTFYNTPTVTGLCRTKETYKHAIEELASNPDKSDVYGIKFDSLFNQLQHFHVCNPGLPPCLGHDLFEGVVSTDLALFIHHLVSSGHFTYNQLNKIINTFKYSGTDVNNKPCQVPANGQKLGGNASQNWCLLRLLPLLIGDRIKKPLEDKTWQLCLQLREIANVITAPRIHANQVAYLKFQIEQYIDSRASVFPNAKLKPKHHYLLHYPELILLFGPLIRLWTMRFESKHTFFKQCARKLQNFKNLTATLAERHQLLQSYLQAGCLFTPTVQMQHTDSFQIHLYNKQIQDSVTKKGLDRDTSVTPCITYKGTTYKRTMVVAFKDAEKVYSLGKIVLILANLSEVYFVIEKYQSVSLIDLGVDCLLESDILYECVSVHELADYYPLSSYKRFDVDLVPFHHSLFQR